MLYVTKHKVEMSDRNGFIACMRWKTATPKDDVN